MKRIIAFALVVACLCPAAKAYQVEQAGEADKIAVRPAMEVQDETEQTGYKEPAPVEIAEPEPDNSPTEPEEEEFDHTAADRCASHVWEYAYGADSDDGDIYYFRYCYYCGLTVDLDACPPELEWTLPDDGTGQEKPDEILDEEVTEDAPETDPADESGDSSMEDTTWERQ